MKTLVTDNPISRIKKLHPSLLLFCFCLFVSLSSYAEYSFIFNSETGTMEVWITGTDPHEFGVSPAGGLAINGICTGILADQINRLIIHGDSANNKIDLRGMIQDDFPNLVTDPGPMEKTEVKGYGGNDEIYGHDLGNNLVGGEGDDILKGGDRVDQISGGSGKDFLYGEGDHDWLFGGDDDDYIEGGDDKDHIFSDRGNDVIVGDDKDYINCPGPGDDVTRLNSSGESQKSTKKDLAYTVTMDEFSHLFITDSSGVDTLDFSQFDEGIVLDLDLFDIPQIYTESEDTLALYGIFESFIGTKYDDIIHIDPDPDVSRYVDGGGSTGGDTLYVDAMGESSSDDGHIITIQGYQPISYESFDYCVITNTPIVGFDVNIESTDENRLLQNVPNPFYSTTSIRFTLKERSDIQLKIYNIQGRLVKNMADGEYFQGSHDIVINGEELSSGIYYGHLQGRGFTDVMKMILLK